MKEQVTRFSLSVPPELASRAAVLKRYAYYDKTYAEMYRQLIALGLEEMEKRRPNPKHPAH